MYQIITLYMLCAKYISIKLEKNALSHFQITHILLFNAFTLIVQTTLLYHCLVLPMLFRDAAIFPGFSAYISFPWKLQLPLFWWFLLNTPGSYLNQSFQTLVSSKIMRLREYTQLGTLIPRMIKSSPTAVDFQITVSVF